jgi:hypothetical protein
MGDCFMCPFRFGRDGRYSQYRDGT